MKSTAFPSPPNRWKKVKTTNPLAAALATWFGCGLAPKAPGTVGTFGGLVVAWPLVAFGQAAPWHFAVLAALVTPIGIWAAQKIIDETGNNDPQQVVIDEVLGVWLTLAGAAHFNWKSFLLAFALFRLFDIWKPWPIRNLEKLHGGTGVIVDDLGAGVYAAVVLALLGWFNLY